MSALRRGRHSRDRRARVVGEGERDKGPGDWAPERLPDLRPVDACRFLAALVLGHALDGPEALLLGQEAREGRAVVEPPVDQGSGEDGEETDDEE
jgi:hypothetical protein